MAVKALVLKYPELRLRGRRIREVLKQGRRLMDKRAKSAKKIKRKGPERTK